MTPGVPSDKEDSIWSQNEIQQLNKQGSPMSVALHSQMVAEFNRTQVLCFGFVFSFVVFHPESPLSPYPPIQQRGPFQLQL